MKQNIDFMDQADAFIKGDMSEAELKAFEAYCSANPEQLKAFDQHRLLVQKLQEYDDRNCFINQLETTYAGLNIAKMRRQARPTGMLAVWRRNKQTVLVAASVALVAVFSTLWLSGFYSNVKETSSNYSALKRDMNNIRKNVNAQSVVLNTMNNKQGKETNPSTFGATGFALTGNGYIATNYHVIQGADSIHVQNMTGESYKAKPIYIDPAFDLAILEITDDRFEPISPVPYTFKDKKADIGQDVFTIGFPREEAVYGRGYLSSETGFGGDTVAYQVSIPVNPGNSGGPVLDDHGNIIGIISGKQTGADGAAFAIKTRYLLQSIQVIPQDSLDQALTINTKNGMKGLSRTDQIKKMQNYIYMVKVY